MTSHSFGVDFAFTVFTRDADHGERTVGGKVRYSYVPASGDNRREPYEPAHCVIDAVEITPGTNSVNVIDWLTDDQIESLERHALADWREKDEAARERAAELRYERVREG